MKEATGARTDSEAGTGTWALLRRLLVFQIKLALDGLRDLLLSPASLIAVLLGLLGGRQHRDLPFRRLLEFGRRTDAWIDLFDSHSDHPAEGDDPDGARSPAAPAGAPRNANGVIDTVERILREEVARGGGLRGVEARLQGLRRAVSDPASVDVEVEVEVDGAAAGADPGSAVASGEPETGSPVAATAPGRKAAVDAPPDEASGRGH